MADNIRDAAIECYNRGGKLAYFNKVTEFTVNIGEILERGEYFEIIGETYTLTIYPDKWWYDEVEDSWNLGMHTITFD